MAKFIIEDSFWDLFPGAAIGVAVVRGITPPGEMSPEDMKAISGLLARANQDAHSHITSPVISENEVAQVWREAYRKFKTKKGARCSIENLLKRVIKDNPVGTINPTVDVYNVISLKYALPAGGEDLDTFVGDVKLGITEGGDEFMALGETKNDPTLPGEVCYRDDAGAICRCWSWRDGQRTALQDGTRNAFLVVESVDPARIEEAGIALEELTSLIRTYLGATVEAAEVLTASHREIELGE